MDYRLIVELAGLAIIIVFGIIIATEDAAKEKAKLEVKPFFETRAIDLLEGIEELLLNKELLEKKQEIKRLQIENQKLINKLLEDK